MRQFIHYYIKRGQMKPVANAVSLFNVRSHGFGNLFLYASLFLVFIFTVDNGRLSAQDVAGVSEFNKPGSASKPLNSIRCNGLNFTQNKGQIIDMELNLRPDVLFQGSIGSTEIFLRKTGISYISTNIAEVLREVEEKVEMQEEAGSKSWTGTQQMKRELLKGETIKLHRTDMDFLDCNPDATVTSKGVVAGYTNYYYSHCTQGITNVGTYNEIDVKDIYPGIDVKYYAGAIQEGGREVGLKYDIVVNPGADPGQIKLKYSGQDKIFINAGKLVIETSLGTMEESLPRVYQVINNRVVDVKAEYKIIQLHESKDVDGAGKSNIVTFKLSDYQAGYPLIIDPWWATYYGGTGSDYGSAIVIDNGGNVLFTGHANSSNFPVSAGAFQFVYGGGVSGKPLPAGTPYPGIYGDAFVVKFDASGNRQWATYYGGTDDEVAYAIAADANGNSAITGFTFSTNMPVAGAFQPANGGKEDVFVAVFNSAGNLKWATYYGGSDVEEGFGITFDPSGNVAITGFTQSLNFPLLGAFQPGFGGGTAFGQLSVCPFFGDMFLVKFNSVGVRQWATYYGGSDNDGGRGIATDAAGNIVVTGGTTSTNFPVTSGTAQGIFIVKFNSTGGRLWSVSLGSGYGEGTGIAIDKGNNIVIVGPAGASLPVQLGAYKLSGRVFLAKFDANGTLLWVTYDGQAIEEATVPNLLAVDVDENGNIYTVHDIEYTGGVLLPDVITTCAFQKKHNNTGGNGGAAAASAEEDLLINKFNGQGKYICSTYIGGKLHDDHELPTKNIAVKGGRMALTGLTFGAFPITPGAFQPVMKSTYAYPYNVHNAFVIDLCTFACGDTTATAPSSIGINAVTNGCQLPKFNVAGNISSCDTSIYSWLFPGAIPSVADGLHVSDIKFPGPGTYTVSLIVNACKLDTIKKSVVIP
ncbi:MAG: SBBP repeat-containing protein, partial [Bacteroidia bacterium]|nr:SBBP repeat-containing protein [Bacteroidia bacterium]